MTDSNSPAIEQFTFKAETRQLLNILIHSLRGQFWTPFRGRNRGAGVRPVWD